MQPAAVEFIVDTPLFTKVGSIGSNRPEISGTVPDFQQLSWCHKILGTPDPHFHYDFGDFHEFGDPSMNSVSIKILEEQVVAISFHRSAELTMLGEISSQLETLLVYDYSTLAMFSSPRFCNLLVKVRQPFVFACKTILSISAMISQLQLHISWHSLQLKMHTVIALRF